MKKIGIAIIAMLMIFPSSVFAQDITTYSDVDEHDKYAEGIYFITKEGIVSGYNDGTYKPSQLVNRAEMTKIFVLAVFSAEQDQIDSYGSRGCFSDVSPNQWYTKYICFAKAKGFVKGYPNGFFRPESNINLVEALKIALNNFNYSATEDQSPWYKEIVNSASSRDFIPLSFTFFDQQVNRGQMADLIARILYFRKGQADLKSYLAFLQNYQVTYATLRSHVNLDSQARNVSKFNVAEAVEFENFNDPSGFQAVLYADTVHELKDTNCSYSYLSGAFKLSVVSTRDGEPQKVMGESTLGSLQVPRKALHGVTMDSTETGSFHSFVVLQEYNNCSPIFRIYKPTRYYKEMKLVDFSDLTDERIAASDIESLHFGKDSLRVTMSGSEKNYKWENDHFVYQSTVQ